MMKILVQVDRLLHAVLVDLLFEITVSVKQPDCDEVQIEVARRFAMVAGQNPKTAGIIWDRFVKTELGRKICDWFLDRAGCADLPVRVLAPKIFLKRLEHLF